MKLFGLVEKPSLGRLQELAKALKDRLPEPSAAAKSQPLQLVDLVAVSAVAPIGAYALPPVPHPPARRVQNGVSEDASWLLKLCRNYVSSTNSPLDGASVAEEILLQTSKAKDDETVQARLFDLLGEQGFETLLEVMEGIDRVRRISPADLRVPAAGSSSSSSSASYLAGADYPTPFEAAEEELDLDSLSLNQRKKALKRMEKQKAAATASGEEQQPGGQYHWLSQIGFSDAYVAQEQALGLRGGAIGGGGGQFSAPPMGDYDDEEEDFSWVERFAETGALAAAGTLEYHEKRGLPAGSERKTGNGYEEVHIPAPPRPVKPPDDALVAISSLEAWAQMAFAGTKRLNTIQSKVFPTAYHSSENMLVCAPTGAGKTNIAMLSFLQLLKQHISGGEIDLPAIKAIYIAPMKALAQEVVAKFSERLAPLGMIVREFTGDMQLTRQQVAESQLLVTTPEKYDVITRKGGDGSLGTLVSLIIIDEVHLLAEDRGAVIETIVARTQRYVETSQRRVRLVGLSATLPNYKDVARFLGVSSTGLHFFGPEFRPVPLDQTFIGITEKQRNKAKDSMNLQAYKCMVTALERGKQVMIFVHSRKETSSTADCMRDLSSKHGTLSLLDNVHHESFDVWSRAVDRSRSQEVQQLFRVGLGVHHAGMLRSDRTLTEQMFESGAIKVLCCTATLAWGVNLPAHTVIIKGTELYDPERGGFVDLSILDVLQIFGRAGRPQYDNTGHAILITPHKSLNNYLRMMGHQAPIESCFIKALADHMNAEIVNGTISTLNEAASWLSYTFLFIRMSQNPLAYGMTIADVHADPQLDKKRVELVTKAAQTLDMAMMIRFDPRSGNIGVTDLGRIASHYYIRHGTIEAFNAMLTAHLSEAEALHVLCSSAEFDTLKVRPEELAEIDASKKICPVKIKAPVGDTAGKVSVLLQGYLLQQRVQAFTLQSDTNYVAQNAGRITRALFELCLRRGWSVMAAHYLELCKCIERRMTPGQTPLRQFVAEAYQPNHANSRVPELPREVLARIEHLQLTRERIVDMSVGEVGSLVHSQKLGGRVLSMALRLPALSLECNVQPITRGILRVTIVLEVAFQWSDRDHGTGEPFWVWLEDGENEAIYHSEYVMMGRRHIGKREANRGRRGGRGDDRDPEKDGEESHDKRESSQVIEFTIPIREPLPPQYYVKAISDRWVGCTTTLPVSFQHLILPDRMPPHTNLLDLHPLPKQALKNPLFESLYKFSHFNPIQTQCFHTLYHTDYNVLIGAPTGSGKTITAEIALLRLRRDRPQAKCVYVAPLKALARERLSDWQRKFGGGSGGSSANGRRGGRDGAAPAKGSTPSSGLGLVITELTGDVTPSVEVLSRSDILIVTPEKWDSISRGWQHRSYVQSVELMILDEVHLLGVDRGPVLEAIVTRARFISAQTGRGMRFIGLSTALANPRDLADWLGIGEHGVYNFRPSVRPVPMTIYIQGFPGKAYCPRMATMNKPCFAAIREHSPHKPALIFVSSRRQTRLTALDLISYCAAEENSRMFLHMDSEEMEAICSTLKDGALRDTLAFGIGIHHAGLDGHDRQTVEQLFSTGKIQVLVCTSTLAWGVNLPCHLVIVKGTEFFDAKTSKYVDFPVTDVLQMIGRAGRPQFDDTGTAVVMCAEVKKNFYKKFLHEPFPVESAMHTDRHLHGHLNAEIATGSLRGMQDCLEYMTWTYLFRRVVYNPSYYGVPRVVSAEDWSEQEDAREERERRDAEDRERRDRDEKIRKQREDQNRSDPATAAKTAPASSTANSDSNASGSRCSKAVRRPPPTTPEAAVWEYFHQVVGACLRDLLAVGCIECGEAAYEQTFSSTSEATAAAAEPFSVLRASPLGLIASRFYLDTRTPMQFRLQLSVLCSDGGRVDGMVDFDDNAGGSFLCDSSGTHAGGMLHSLLLVLCNCHEFDEVPVRHNEDVLNMQLAALLPWPVDPAMLHTAHTKTNLLVQAAIGGSLSGRANRVKLPISDYLNDTKSVLDQFNRVHAALLEVAKAEGRVEVIKPLESLLTLVTSGRGLSAAADLSA